jgi:hypothetical protein
VMRDERNLRLAIAERLLSPCCASSLVEQMSGNCYLGCVIIWYKVPAVRLVGPTSTPDLLRNASSS